MSSHNLPDKDRVQGFLFLLFMPFNVAVRPRMSISFHSRLRAADFRQPLRYKYSINGLRSAARNLARAGVKEQTAMKITGHKTASCTGDTTSSMRTRSERLRKKSRFTWTRHATKKSV